jgi:hypothetical protein
MYSYRNTVNLLTNMPRESFEELLTPATDSDTGSEPCAAAAASSCDDLVYDGKNMEAIAELLEYLKKHIDVVKSFRFSPCKELVGSIQVKVPNLNSSTKCSTLLLRVSLNYHSMLFHVSRALK